MSLTELLAYENPVHIARSLLGVELVSRLNGVITSGIITETEAYWAPEDQASHARNNRRTTRTEVFYAAAGTAYVYLIYGMHELFNIVTGPTGIPHAVLIRAIEPKEGIEHMLARRVMKNVKPQLSAGPGVLTKALGIDRSINGIDLLAPTSPVSVQVTDRQIEPSQIVATPRIGIDYAGSPWVEKPWRFYLRGTPFVSRLKKTR